MHTYVYAVTWAPFKTRLALIQAQMKLAISSSALAILLLNLRPQWSLVRSSSSSSSTNSSSPSSNSSISCSCSRSLKISVSAHSGQNILCCSAWDPRCMYVYMSVYIYDGRLALHDGRLAPTIHISRGWRE